MNKDNTKFRITGGNCPNCNSQELEYMDSMPIDDGYMYEFECADCGVMGEEHYILVFDGYSINNNDDYFEVNSLVELHKQQVENVRNKRDMTYLDLDTGKIETYEEIEDYYNDNPEIKASFDDVDDLISQSYTQKEEK